MKTTLLVAASALALLAVTSCSGQRPPVVAQPGPTPIATEEPTGRPGPTCTDWNSHHAVPHDAANARYLAGADGLNPADAARLVAGLDNYCRRVPGDDLRVAAQSVVLCLWPASEPESLRGPDCTAVRGEFGP